MLREARPIFDARQCTMSGPSPVADHARPRGDAETTSRHGDAVVWVLQRAEGRISGQGESCCGQQRRHYGKRAAPSSSRSSTHSASALRASASPMTRQRRHHTCRDFGDGRQTPPTHSPLVLTDPRTQLLSVAARRRSRTSPATAARRPGCARPVHKADQGGAASPQQPAHWAGAQCAARSHRPLRVEGFCFSLHSDALEPCRARTVTRSL